MNPNYNRKKGLTGFVMKLSGGSVTTEEQAKKVLWGIFALLLIIWFLLPGGETTPPVTNTLPAVEE